MSDNNSSSSGIGLTGLLGVAFVILKLCKVIDWSWWWVTCPFWGGAAIIVLILIIVLVIAAIRTTPGNPRYQPKSKWQQRVEEMQNKKR